MRMPELKALTRECRLRGYSRLRKAELIELIRNNQWPSMPQRALNQPPHPNRPPPSPPTQTWEPIDDRLRPKSEAPLTKRQLKRRRNKDSKLAKKFKSLEAESNNLKSQMGALKDKTTKASKSTNARFKRKKIRSMKREANKINEKLATSEAKLESVKPRVTLDPICGPSLKLHPPNRSKHIEAKIAEINKKIRRARHKNNKKRLITKREALCTELNWGPRQLEGALSGAYRRYRIYGVPRMNPDTFFSRIRRFLIDLLKKESRTGTIRAEMTTWIRFRKDGELVELAFNGRMMNVYNLSDMAEIVDEMIAHMKERKSSSIK